jgi:hypothetical protein
MSLFRTGANTAVAVPQYTALQLQTSSSALPIPIVYGITQVAPNLIWADGFQTHPQYTQQSGGKGGGQKTRLSGYTYSTAVIFGIGGADRGARHGVPRPGRAQCVGVLSHACHRHDAADALGVSHRQQSRSRARLSGHGLCRLELFRPRLQRLDQRHRLRGLWPALHQRGGQRA